MVNGTKPINLWNIGEGKTKAVIEYVTRMYPARNNTRLENDIFQDFKTRALECTVANDMLSMIQYRYMRRDGIFWETTNRARQMMEQKNGRN